MTWGAGAPHLLRGQAEPVRARTSCPGAVVSRRNWIGRCAGGVGAAGCSLFGLDASEKIVSCDDVIARSSSARIGPHGLELGAELGQCLAHEN